MNVTGDLINKRGLIKTNKFLPIYANPPSFTNQSTTAEILVTSIKVINLLALYAYKGKISLFSGASVNKTIFIQELINNITKAYSKYFIFTSVSKCT